MKVKFEIIESRIKVNGKCPILLRLTLKRKITRISSKIEIEPKYWDKTKLYDPIVIPSAEKRKGGASLPNANILNTRLNKLLRKAHDFIEYEKLHERNVTVDDVIKVLNGFDNRNFIHFASEELEKKRKRKKKFSHNTYRTAKARLNTLIEFVEENYGGHLTIEEVTVDFLEEYEGWCNYEKGYEINTTETKLRFVREFIKLAFEKGLTNQYPFNTFKLTREVKEKEYLRPEEVQKLNALFDSGELEGRLQNVLNYFLVACYTGVRYSDYYRLLHYNGKDDSIRIAQTKTLNSVTLYLSKRAKELIVKPYQLNSNQKTNTYLKEIMLIAGIDKKITTHSARHTFASNVISKGASLKELQELLGHKDYKSTLVYAHLLPDKKMETMKNFDY
ncbi:site-specific integrase [Flammeovirga aprica]|uniref:Site-specific integrase n=1 Tax=Flammeovirga aprica JL-4 TaxID=694437 RepID=A0A7X9NZ46_9BACT|nr:site-specific integrase [Flammeovirga aprica]NME66594.1 site-specific integrase [Flammeovirga aprica JL-4]